MLHPVLGRSMMQLLEHLERALNYVAITGVPGVGKSLLVKSLLANAVATRVGAEAILDARPAGQPVEHAASRSLQVELEFLRDRCELLRNVKPTGKEPYAISDFWLGHGFQG
jgi:deoxyadenosine/deoxycytidine kinase